jgi:hypothetical protein
MDPEMMDPNDPERFKKRVEMAVSVSARIQKMAIKKRGSVKIISKEERQLQILVRKAVFSKQIQSDKLY